MSFPARSGGRAGLVRQGSEADSPNLGACAIPFGGNIAAIADVAQLVERNLAKVEVAGSIPVVRSAEGGLVTALFRRRGRVVRQGSAKP